MHAKGKADKLEFEYLDEEKIPDAPRSLEPRGDFSFDGHRLSSLYRAVITAGCRLIFRYANTFSLQKYSTGVDIGSPLVRETMATGCETPAFAGKRSTT